MRRSGTVPEVWKIPGRKSGHIQDSNQASQVVSSLTDFKIEALIIQFKIATILLVSMAGQLADFKIEALKIKFEMGTILLVSIYKHPVSFDGYSFRT